MPTSSRRRSRGFGSRGYGVIPLENVEPHDRERQAEEQAAARRRLKTGRYGDVIWGGGYLTVDEIEAAIVMGEKNHPGYFERIPLPHPTWEEAPVSCLSNRHGRAARSGRRSAFSRGCTGANGAGRTSWSTSPFGSCARTGTGKASGWRKVFTPAQVRATVETMDIVLSPGKSRRAALQHGAPPVVAEEPAAGAQGAGPRAIGVDINRNFPFLWRFDRHFAPKTVRELLQARRLRELRRSPRGLRARDAERDLAAGSVSQHPILVDLHSYGETILHSWGTDENQSDDPRMNFRNPAYDGMRGRIHDDVYREYLPAADAKVAVRGWGSGWRRDPAGAGKRIQGEAVGRALPNRGRVGRLRLQSAPGGSSKGKFIAYTIEWGRSRASTPFHPPYGDAEGHARGERRTAGPLPPGSGETRAELHEERAALLLTTAPGVGAGRSLLRYFFFFFFFFFFVVVLVAMVPALEWRAVRLPGGRGLPWVQATTAVPPPDLAESVVCPGSPPSIVEAPLSGADHGG